MSMWWKETFFGDNVIKTSSFWLLLWIHEDNYVSSSTSTILHFGRTFAYDSSDFIHCRPPFLNLKTGKKRASRDPRSNLRLIFKECVLVHNERLNGVENGSFKPLEPNCRHDVAYSCKGAKGRHFEVIISSF